MAVGETLSNYPYGFNSGLLLQGLPLVGIKPGNTFWVDSGIGSNNNAGKTPSKPFATLDSAIGKCTANNGDIIYISPGHSESLTADSGVDIDVAGVTVVGLGSGESRPVFTFTTAATADFKIAAANVTILNLVFKCNIASQDMMIEVSGDDATIGACEFREGSATGLNFITIGVADNDADRCRIHDCKFYMPTAGNGDSAISFAKDHAGVIIERCDIYGDFDLAGIDIPAGGNAQVDCTIRNCKITNLLTGQHAIQVNGTGSTGVISDVYCVTDTQGTDIDAGGLEMFNCYFNDGTDQSGWTTIGTISDSSTNVLGADDSNNAFSSSNVVSNPDGSLLERAEYLQKLQEVLTAEQLRSVAGSSMPLAVWYVDANIGASGDGKSPATAFKTLAEAITACDNSVDDWILVFDYSGGGSTLTINKAFVHIIGNANKCMPYPRIKPASAVDGIEITAAGDRVEIANLVIGAGDQTKACIAIDTAGGGGAYGVYIHDCVIGRDADAPGLLGVSVVSGGAAPYLVVDNNRFYGSAGAGIAAAGSAIKIDGNATRCRISNNYISDIGRTATPAIWLSGSVTEPQIVGNHIKTDTDTGTGSAITLAAGVDDGWIARNYASDGKDAPANNPFVDAGSTNGWSENYSGIVATLP